MKRRIFAALLAGAMILSLAACGGGNGGGSSSASGSGSTGGASSSQDGSASSDPSAPDGSLPGGSSSSGSSSSSGDASSPSGSSSSSGSGSSSGAGDSSKPSGQVTLKLNKTKIALNKAGATFKLRCTTDPEIDADPTYTSSDEKVATVDKKGTVTAVAPGKATITVECGGASATAAVTCDWKVSEPAPAPDASAPVVTPPVSTVPVPPSGPVTITPTPPASSGGSTTPSVPEPVKVDLSSFYSATTGKYEFGSLEKADSAVLDQIYSGLTGVGTEQSMVYVTMMSMNNGEFGLVQVKDSKDVDTVKKIFQDRIAYMVGDGNGPGGAYYPSAMDQWENNSRVVSNGNYVMLVVHENCDDIVGEFNALFSK